MPTVVGVAFKKAGKVYHFGTNGLDLHEGMNVITHTKRGWKMGLVVTEPKDIKEEEIIGDFSEVERVATQEDIERVKTHPEIAARHFKVCEEKIAEHGLPMRLLSAELSFDETMITFFFSAENRVDFRELVRDVAGAIHLKVQLMQIGVRDEAKLIGGYGSCGRQLCCSLFIKDLSTSVSMKMAKDQSLFLNPAKFSGCCGKLMCCLKFENDFYNEMQNALPAIGTFLNTEKGVSKIKEYNYIAGTVILQSEEGNTFTLPLSRIDLNGVCKKHGVNTSECSRECQYVDPDVLKKLGILAQKKKDEEMPFTIPSYEGSTSIAFDFPEEEDAENKSKKKQKQKDRRGKQENKQKQKKAKGPRPFSMGGGDADGLGIVFRDIREDPQQSKKKKKHKSSGRQNQPAADKQDDTERKDTANE